MRRRIVIGAAIAVAALAGLRLADRALAPPAVPGGPPSSAFSTGPSGVAGYADLLRRSGREVVRLRDPLDRAALRPDDVVLVLDAPVRPEEADALLRHVRAGGRLVAASTTAQEWLAPVLPSRPDPRLGGPTESAVLAPAPETRGVSTVVGDGVGFATERGGALPLLGDGDVATALAVDAGEGRIVMLADASPLANGRLGEADNAAFALALVPPGSRAVFAEHGHGYGRGEGLADLPDRVAGALVGLAIALGVLYWARARRLGPPERPARELPPPRAAYVEAIASTLAQTPDAGRALAPLRDEGRRRLVRRLPPAARAAADDPGALRDAAAGAGLAADEVDALLGDAGDRATMLAVGRAVARLGGEDGGR